MGNLMKHCANLFLLLLIACMSSPAVSASLTGGWRFMTDLNGGLNERTCQFQQAGANIKGACRNNDGAVMVTGSIKGQDVTFQYPIDVYGQSLPVQCTGRLTPAGLSGDLTLGHLRGDCYLAQVTSGQLSSRAHRKCQAYLGRSIEGAVVTRAELLPALGPTPQACLVRGEMPQDLDFEVRMPTHWNKRTVFIGAGGFAGSIDRQFYSAQSIEPNTPAYATIATNHGHSANVTSGASFALDVQMLNEYAHLAVPRVMAPAKAILRDFYGRGFKSTKIVYEGCSGGGRQGMIQAQRYPELFDGVIARAPATSIVPQFLWYSKVQKLQSAPGGALTPGKIATIGATVRARCDGLDGLEDEIISRPDICDFDPAEIACAVGSDSDSCLTPEQVATARGFYEGVNLGDGRFTWPGFMPGGESAENWLGWQAIGFDGFMRYFVAQDSKADPLSIAPEDYLPRLEYLSNLLDADDPALHRFKENGGKLILWTGQADWLITANNATAYYNSVVNAMGGQAKVDDFLEYYISPDVGHCSGGPGPDFVDLVSPLFEWLEDGVRPSEKQLIATSSLQDAEPVTRPLCQYPRYPKYLGGDTRVAASFTCAMPSDETLHPEEL